MSIRKKMDCLKNRISSFLRLIVLIILIAIASIMAPGFLSMQNILNLLRSFSFLGFVSIGMTFVILSGGIDLSVAAIFAFSGVLLGLFQHWGIYLGHVDTLSLLAPTPILFLMILAIGSFLGFINGVIITKLKVADFAATLGTMIFIRGLAFAISGGRTIFNLDDIALFMGRGMIGPVPFVAILFILSVIICAILLRYTIFGKRLYATGENPVAAKLSGINPIKYKIIVYTLSGFFASLAGICMAGRLNVGEPRVAEGWELDAIAAVVIGGTSFAGGKGGVVKTVIGVIIIGLIRNILSLLGILPDPQEMIMGLVLLCAVVFGSFGSRKGSLSNA
ncbi:Ribose import permease protein RbsC [bioreactor metagenome]|jgi:ribose/xylose/arabinose/galactoside ABC-type transport system permease subunit|uniref:Ribose import permease protein RbsC n=1 Tax=bioreactor metagenome TaxID=1076179 RepID=A0A644TIG8_9ZZZZ|nr:Ribose transport system permease protein RbsC [uncultured Spirochaetota bacterium]